MADRVTETSDMTISSSGEHVPNEPERFFFAHVQKTAGTTLYRRLKRLLGSEAIYPNDTDGDTVTAVLVPDHLLERWRVRGDAIRVVTGHFPLCTKELLDGDFATFTVLREPVARTLSYLRHHRKLTPEDRERSFEAIYDDPLRFHGLIHNHMVKMFSLTRDEMTDGVLTRVDFSADRLEMAKERLAGVDVVGLQEHFDDFYDALSRRFGWHLGKPAHANRTEPSEVSEALTSRIAEDNALDVELYEFGRNLVGERASLDQTSP